MSDEPLDASNLDYQALRSWAMSYPEATEEFPWGHSAIKVRKKTFVFLSCTKESLGLSVKLPQSREAAVTLTDAVPTGYGLGKHGWVSAKFAVGEEPVPVEMLQAWIDESYRALAPKGLIKTLPESGPNQEK